MTNTANENAQINTSDCFQPFLPLNKATLRHKAEIPIYVCAVIISILIYYCVTWLVLEAPNDAAIRDYLIDAFEVDEEVIDMFISMGSMALDIAFGILACYIVWKIFRESGHAAAFDVRVSDTQLSKFKHYRFAFGKALKLDPIPQVFATSEFTDIEICGVIIKNRSFIRIDSDLAKGPYEDEIIAPAVPFYIAKEMGHIYLGHASVIMLLLTFPARCVPIFKELFNRTRNYSADRVAYALMGDAAINAIGMTVVNPEMLYNLDPDTLFREKPQIHRRRITSGIIFDNIFSNESIPQVRIEALEQNTRSARLF